MQRFLRDRLHRHAGDLVQVTRCALAVVAKKDERCSVVDGGFVKIRNITFGYTIPERIASKAKMTKLRLFVSAQNPVTWSDYKLFDPERAGNVTSGAMPSNRMFLGGINISF